MHTFDFVCEANVSAEKTSIFNPNDLGTVSPFRGHSLRELSPLKKKKKIIKTSAEPLAAPPVFDWHSEAPSLKSSFQALAAPTLQPWF